MGQHAPWVGFRAHAHMSQWEGALPRLRCNIGGKMQGGVSCSQLLYSESSLVICTEDEDKWL